MAKSDLDPELLKQAEELNIEVTDAATNEALKAAIDEVLAEDGAGNSAAGDIVQLRADYKALSGKNAFNGWDATELQKRINAAGSPPQAKPAKPKKAADPLDHDADGKKGGAAPALVAVRILRDIWLDNPDNPAEPIRYREGSIREVSMNDAFDGIESGAFSRVK